MTTITRQLKVTLEDTEKRVKGEELARALERYDEIEADTKAASTKAKEEMKRLREKSQGLAREIRDGAELRIIQCHERPDYRGNQVRLLRDDTLEVVETRPMRLDERQSGLPFDEHGEVQDS